MSNIFASDAFIIAFLVAIYLSVIAYTAYCAKRVGRRPIVWGLGAAVLGFFALGALLGLSLAQKTKASQE
jgi:hypothetical protein